MEHARGACRSDGAYHNRLNEDAWAQVLKWEARFGGGQWFPSYFTYGIVSSSCSNNNYAKAHFHALRFAPPFDRHDWIVRRPATGKSIRYVIDYYSARKSVLHEPEFYLDVRPASDGLANMCMKVQYPLEHFVSRILRSAKPQKPSI
ncbi:cytochrome c/c1 heme lyase-domain-containing protein, partial [Flammula alnicola]